MQRTKRRRLSFDEGNLHEYPKHLWDPITDMPTAEGLYVFHGQKGDLPHYIGKSINLRNPDEARLLRQTIYITHVRTAGEIGALLLEAQMIKQQHPLHNQKLRRNITEFNSE